MVPELPRNFELFESQVVQVDFETNKFGFINSEISQDFTEIFPLIERVYMGCSGTHTRERTHTHTK